MGNGDNFALDWIKSELETTLDQARAALESYAEDGREETRLRSCLTSLHQVHGTLRMLELDGVALMAEHMEQTAQSLLNGSIKDARRAEQVLMQASLQLPLYLEEVQSGLVEDMPLVIADVNELRECCSLRALQLTPPVSADFSESDAQRVTQRFAKIDGAGKTSRIRSAFQVVLLNVLKGEVTEKTVGTLIKVASGLQKVCEGSPLVTLWASLQFFGAGYKGSPEKLSSEAIGELRRVDTEIKRLSADGASALLAPLPIELIRDLLRTAEALGQNDEEISALRSAVQVPRTVESKPRQALEQAVTVLREELSGVRDAFDLFVRAEQYPVDELKEVTAALDQIAGTCGVLGYPELETLLREQRQQIDALQSSDDIHEDLLLNIASSLVRVDAEIDDAANGESRDQEATGTLGEAQLAVVQEARSGLEQIKHAIVDSMTAEWDSALLKNVPQVLAAVQGALTMVPLTRAADMLTECTSYVQNRLLAGHTPEVSEIETFADALSGIDYYLERLYANDASTHSYVLDEVAQRLDTLAELLNPAGNQQQAVESEPTNDDGSSADELALTEVVDEASSSSVDIDHSNADPSSVVNVSEVGSQPLPDADDIPFETDEEIDLMSLDFGDEDLDGHDGEVIDSEQTSGRDETTEIDALVGTSADEIGFVESADTGRESSELDGASEGVPEGPANPEMPSTPHPLPGADQPGNVSATLDLVDFDESDGGAGQRQPASSMAEETRAKEVELEELATASAGDPAGRSTAASASGDAKPTGQAAVNSTTVGDIDIDPEIVEIFVEEVDEVLEAIHAAMPLWSADLSGEEPLGEIRRGFHTLKGSGRIVGANQIGELAWSVENMLNRVLDGTIKANADHLQLVQRVCAEIPDLKADFSDGRAEVRPIVHDLMEGADVLSSGGSLGQTLADSETSEADAEDDVAQDDITQAPEEVEEPSAELLFAEEATEHLAVLQASLNGSATGDLLSLEPEFMRGLHTISGSAATVGQAAVSEVAGTLETLCGALIRERAGQLDGEYLEFVREGVQSIAQLLSDRSADELSVDSNTDTDDFVKEAQRLVSQLNDASSLPETMLEAAYADALIDAPAFLLKLRDGVAEADQFAPIGAALNHLCDTQLQPQMTELAGSLLKAHEAHSMEGLSEELYQALLGGHERLLICLDAVAAEQPAPTVDEELTALAAGLDAHAAQKRRQEALDQQALEQEALEQEALRAQSNAEALMVESSPDLDTSAQNDTGVQSINELDEIDPELIDIFFEEAEEILEDMDKSLQQWQDDRSNSVHLENLLRGLHTLKGGARLSRLLVLGDMAHDYESDLIRVQESGVAISDERLASIQTSYDELAQCVSQARSGDMNTSPEEHKNEDASSVASMHIEDSLPSSSDPKTSDDSPAEVAGAITTEITTKPDVADIDEDRSRSGQEMVRVSASLLEDLVNIAGESSIVRARVEQGMTDFSGALEEMETTIERVREQLRRLEIETETRMLSRTGSTDASQYEDFDPLEMDRYSQLEQLTRSLTESATDMLDLKETLRYRAREAETLLMQQARLNTELQEGLMRTRMVPFSRLMPRLRSIVRQVSRELGKEVEFHAYNAEGELDRNVLERMVPPLEHMLRNAIDHGIEASDMRHNFGKPTAGRVNLRLMREGGDVVIEITDDGAGIDVESVRVKAAERGLMEPGAPLSDEQVMEFVLAPGFSTAKSLTQISGRGVGMDVVHSEVKQLGGSIAISSVPGKGTSFTVRLPFTVSVNRALMVSLSDDQYAIPLSTIEGIVLLPVEEIDNLQKPDAPPFEYAGIPYRVRYLGNYLGREYVSRTDKATVPIVLVRSGDHAVAVLVDDVQGSREIVVKSLGPQFAGVGGISGATILGDGSVVVILDLLALIRSRGANAAAEPPRALANAAEEPRWVMVVDDSVTVRKVTSRLLERQGMNVMVAKDGVEAVALLQERRPDIVLLDIEMPRMDGFEVARQVRHDERLSDLPIVMISSRTGHKHTDRAKELGVNAFLGKPFQENELLETIDELVTRK